MFFNYLITLIYPWITRLSVDKIFSFWYDFSCSEETTLTLVLLWVVPYHLLLRHIFLYPCLVCSICSVQYMYYVYIYILCSITKRIIGSLGRRLNVERKNKVKINKKSLKSHFNPVCLLIFSECKRKPFYPQIDICNYCRKTCSSYSDGCPSLKLLHISHSG